MSGAAGRGGVVSKGLISEPSRRKMTTLKLQDEGIVRQDIIFTSRLEKGLLASLTFRKIDPGSVLQARDFLNRKSSRNSRD